VLIPNLKRLVQVITFNLAVDRDLAGSILNFFYSSHMSIMFS